MGGLFALAGLLAITGCASSATGAGAGDDLAACSTYACKGGCDTTADCTAGDTCDPQAHQCFACLVDRDCAPGQLCNAASHACAAGCSMSHGCGDGGLCERDAGVCVACLGDGDCGDPMNPRCDPALGRCVPCLPGNDNCGHALYCAPSGMSHLCQPGCKADPDCAPLAPDGGSGDGGGADGGSGDGGAGGVVSAQPHCDPTDNQCVRCLVDDHCPAGKVCRGKACVDGCTDQHGCDNPLSCCNQTCVDGATDSSNCGGCGIACAGGWSCCNAACINPVMDPANCGACGTMCMVANGTPGCAGRVCTVLKCDMGWADCNGVAMDGCETHTDVNVNNCGACSVACDIPHANAKCVGGACQIDTCLFPFADCDGNPANGCETNTEAADPQNCGGCGSVCAPQHAMGQCVNGACKVSACNMGWGDCNKDPSDGCEVDLTSAAMDCGACGNACMAAHGSPACVGSQCRVGACDMGWADCDGDPKNGCEVNIAADVLNCGACGTVCPSQNGAPSCAAGACKLKCNPGFADCDGNPANGCEQGTDASASNCGACGVVCMVPNASPACGAGVCKVGNCNPGFLDCNMQPADGCEVVPASDVKNCGACGSACSVANASPKCALGSCGVGQCNPGYADCNMLPGDGCEVYLLGDVANCGGCKLVCSNNNGMPSCVGGACAINCTAGYADCNMNAGDGCEVNLNTSLADCGGCGAVCNLPNATPVCAGGACKISQCSNGYADCNNLPGDGCEVLTSTDAKNCGGCGNACALANAQPSCVGGACAVAQCVPGFADCNHNPLDGCEINLETNANNCNACNAVCAVPNATPGCSGGACVVLQCNNGYADCDGSPANGCEINTNTSTANCGGCGKQCALANAVAACSGGACAVAMCNGGFGDCDGLAANGCETNTNTSAGNCGACGKSCALQNASSSCVGGACAVASCNAGWGDCNGNAADGCETNLNTSVPNCGGCGNACSPANGSGKCNNGGCQVASCNAGFGDCDGNAGNGCEINLKTSVANCGNCGASCNVANASGDKCVGGVCAPTGCNVGFADCDGAGPNGCEVNLNTDGANCGQCGYGCGAHCGPNVAASQCSAGACIVASCNGGWVDYVNGCTDGCECADTTDGATCNAPTSLGVLATGQSVTRSSNLVPLGREAWYSVTFGSNTSQTFHPHVKFTVNPNSEFVFDIRTDCAGTAIGCGAEGGTTTGKTDWEIQYQGGLQWGGLTDKFDYIAAPGQGGTVYIHVYRNAGQASCDTFTIQVSD